MSKYFEPDHDSDVIGQVLYHPLPLIYSCPEKTPNKARLKLIPCYWGETLAGESLLPQTQHSWTLGVESIILPCYARCLVSHHFQVFSFPTTSRWIPVPRSPFLETWFIQTFSRFCLWSSTSPRAWCCAQLGILQEYPGQIWKDRVKPRPFLTISPDDILQQLSLPLNQLSPFRFDSISKHLPLSVIDSFRLENISQLCELVKKVTNSKLRFMFF